MGNYKIIWQGEEGRILAKKYFENMVGEYKYKFEFESRYKNLMGEIVYVGGRTNYEELKKNIYFELSEQLADKIFNSTKKTE